MPEGKKLPAPAPVREEDSYSAKTHLHQPVQETATVAATAQPADAPEGALPSEVRPEIVTWDKLCEAIKASGRAYDMDMIEKAYNLANDAHKGVCRRSGEPYICHPLAVARLVLDLGMDSESIAAALLHDVVEDTPTTLDDLTAQFGSEVAQMVDGVTKLTKIQFSNIEELQAENLRKMLLAMSRDVRVMIIKLCDRLHNMRTGDAWPEQKRRDKARETMEVYAPIANRLGILNVKEELEDRSLHYLDPVGYEDISKMLSERAGEEFLAKVSGVIERRLIESGIEGATIKRRVKSIYGIYRKTIMQNKSFDEIYDIYAVRVILDSLAECYSTLGLIHDMYHPLPNRFKDYISTPKPNGYQSLHTTVIGHEGIPFEVQIRTRAMDEQAEYGVAAHWKYKEGLGGHDKLDERLAWVSQLLENQRVSEDSGNLLHDLKSDLLPEEVFAFTPKGDVINLPTGATCIESEINKYEQTLVDYYQIVNQTSMEHNRSLSADYLQTTSSTRVWPSINTKLYLAIGFVFFFLVGCALAVVVGRSRDFVEYFMYVDKKTGLPNRDRVDAMMARLEKQGLLPSHFTCMCFQFTSLNHLSREYGYSVGNHVLRDFAGLVAALGTEESFIGSNGAGQIVGFFRECNAVKAEAILEVLDEQIQEYNSLNPDYAIEYRAASATSDDEKEFNIRDLLRCAFKKLRDANKPQPETAHETV